MRRVFAVVLVLMLTPSVYAATALWPGSLWTWGGPAKRCAAIGSGGTLWATCTVDDPDCGTSPPVGACVATIIQSEGDQVYEEVEAIEAWLPGSRTKAAGTDIVTADGAGGSGLCAEWNADGSLGDSGEACRTTRDVTCVTIPAMDSGADNVPLFAADPDASVTTELMTVWCHCRGTCATPATLTFATRAGIAISITGGGALTCATGTAVSTATTFDNTDSDRLIAAGGDAEFSTSNSPTTNTSVTICVAYQDS